MTSRSLASRAAPGALLLLALACGSESPEPERASMLLDGPAPGLVASAEPATLEVPADAPLVAFLGDSLSAGLHLPARAAFPAVLQRRLAGSEHPFRLLNAGVSGDTSAGGLRRLDWVLAREPDLLVVELGGNDGLRGQPIASIEANLAAIVEGAQQAGVAVLLLAVRMPKNYGGYATDFAAMYPRLAERLDLAVVDLLDGVGGVAALNMGDGLHPTEEGHEKLADNVEEALRAMLSELAAG